MSLYDPIKQTIIRCHLLFYLTLSYQLIIIFSKCYEGCEHFFRISVTFMTLYWFSLHLLSSLCYPLYVSIPFFLISPSILVKLIK